MIRQLLQQALDLAESTNAYHGLIEMLKAELAKPEPKPLGYGIFIAGVLDVSFLLEAQCHEEINTALNDFGMIEEYGDAVVRPLYAGEPPTKEGFVLVPVEPTRKMLDAGHLDLTLDYGVDTMLKYAWSQMIEAAKEQK